MSAVSATEHFLLRHAGHLVPAQARSFLTFPVQVPDGAASLVLRLRFQPARPAKHRNLVTLSLFDPNGFRGAAHRHAPEQEIIIGSKEASPGFLARPIVPGKWIVELDLHAVLPSPVNGVDYELEVLESPVSPPPASLEDETPVAAPTEPGEPADPSHLRPTTTRVRTEQVVSTEPVRSWLKGDLHLHSNHSDGKWTVGDIVQYVRQHKLDFLALTDHNTISGREGLRTALAEAGLDVVLIPGMELTTFWGHANALGVTEWVDWRVRGPEGKPARVGEGRDAPAARTMAEAAAEVTALGGMLVVNHPRSAGYPACTGCRWELGDASAQYAAALEVMNGHWPRPQNDQAIEMWDRWLNAGHRIPATAGSDSHGFTPRPELLGFTFAWAERTPEAILRAVRAGRTYLSRGPSVEWLDPLPGTALAKGASGITVRVNDVSGDLTIGVVAEGGRVTGQLRAVREAGQIQIEFSPDAREASWYRVHIYGRSGDQVALTNPIYRA